MEAVWKYASLLLVSVFGYLFWTKKKRDAEIFKLKRQLRSKQVQADSKALQKLLTKTQKRRDNAKKLMDDYFSKYPNAPASGPDPDVRQPNSSSPDVSQNASELPRGFPHRGGDIAELSSDRSEDGSQSK